METLTEEQENASKAVCRFEEDNKNLSLNEKTARNKRNPKRL